jgi:hypothetical protein
VHHPLGRYASVFVAGKLLALLLAIALTITTWFLKFHSLFSKKLNGKVAQSHQQQDLVQVASNHLSNSRHTFVEPSRNWKEITYMNMLAMCELLLLAVQVYLFTCVFILHPGLTLAMFNPDWLGCMDFQDSI